MKRIGLACSLLIPLLGVNIANAMPKDCPNAVEIQAVGVSTNVVKFNNAWVAGRRNQMYGTPNHWTFLIVNIIAKDALDAYKKGAKALESLVFQAGPFSSPDGKTSVCAYNTHEGYSAFAMTPPSSLTEAATYVAKS